MSDKKLYLLDGHALVYRAHYAFIARPLINSKGLNTSAIAGFTRTLWDLINKEHCTHIGVSFDLSGPTFRHEVFPEYKANREAQPEDITLALPYIMKIIEAFKVPIVTMQGYEADDVIGTLAKKAELDGFKVYMVTPDKDYAQLVSDNIFMYKPARKGDEVEILGAKEVCEKWQIKRVDQVIDVLGLQGDSVDNIPGIPGVGPKTAIKLLDKFDTIEGVIENANQLKGKQKERVIEFAEQALLSKQLATIDINVPVDFNGDDFHIDPYNKEALSELFKELEFRTLAKQILTPKSNNSNNKNTTQPSLFDSPISSSTELAAHAVADKNIHNTPHYYQLIDTIDKQQKLAQQLAIQPTICFDTETTSIDATVAELVGISFAYKTKEAYYVPVPSDAVAAKTILAIFQPILENSSIIKIGQNIKYDAIIMKSYGIKVRGTYFDTMIAHYLIEPELRHGMNYLAETYLKYQPISIETLIGKKEKNRKLCGIFP